mmetsp:Transcript_29331/g.68009  ORF Transcript_29331/g.68009 Transcript_29331/m.68009 type:complete len:112 (-) Transcript_29331:329-664(-)
MITPDFLAIFERDATVSLAKEEEAPKQTAFALHVALDAFAFGSQSVLDHRRHQETFWAKPTITKGGVKSTVKVKEDFTLPKVLVELFIAEVLMSKSQRAYSKFGQSWPEGS